jgi:tRNA pseudouridine55 synthase
MIDRETLAEEFTAGKVLLLNKPLYWTSFDLLRKIRGILKSQLGIKKIKVGHAGTLDPLATGLMIVCTGKETKNVEQYQSAYKEYLATITLGGTTPSFDLETAVDATYATDHITIDAVEQALQSFTGKQLQAPPAFSARFVNGKRAYELARKGEAVELQSREIDIRSISLISFSGLTLQFRVTCSKGTYIRSLARDLGERLESGAYLSGLVRTASGDFFLTNAMEIEEFERNLVLL